MSLNDQMIDNKMCLIDSTKTLSFHGLLQTHKLGSYLVSTGTKKIRALLPYICFLIKGKPLSHDCST